MRKKINDLLNSDGDKIQTKIEKTAAKYSKYCPVKSVDVKRISSAFKLV